MRYTELFRRLREEKDLSHEALARLARCHRNTVLNVERGRLVKFKTLARLMGKMGYPSDSPEMASLALLWLESVSGLDLADPASLAPIRQKLAVYQRTAKQTAQQLSDTVRQAGLTDKQIRLLIFAARRPEVLTILDSINDLLQAGGESPAVELRVAEPK